MKPLTLEETRLKEQMKERCLAKGQYIDENAKAKFDMLCHLEDFEVQYWELQQENQSLKKENKILRENAEHNDKVVDKVNWENQELKKELEEKNKPQIFIDTQDIEERYAEGLYQDYLEEENKKYKNQQKEFIEYLESYLKLFDNKDIYEEGSYDTIEEILSKYKEIIEK